MPERRFSAISPSPSHRGSSERKGTGCWICRPDTNGVRATETGRRRRHSRRKTTRRPPAGSRSGGLAGRILIVTSPQWSSRWPWRSRCGSRRPARPGCTTRPPPCRRRSTPSTPTKARFRPNSPRSFFAPSDCLRSPSSGPKDGARSPRSPHAACDRRRRHARRERLHAQRSPNCIAPYFRSNPPFIRVRSRRTRRSN